MPEGLHLMLTLAATLGCGLVAGIFFAFSAFVMKALARLPAEQGIAAMQSINLVVLNPWFFAAFFGTTAVCVLTVIAALWNGHGPTAFYSVMGAALYLVGTGLVTIVFNVPKNESLALISPTHPDSARLWSSYVKSWTVWNHVGTAAALCAAAAYSIALGY